LSNLAWTMNSKIKLCNLNTIQMNLLLSNHRLPSWSEISWTKGHLMNKKLQISISKRINLIKTTLLAMSVYLVYLEKSFKHFRKFSKNSEKFRKIQKNSENYWRFLKIFEDNWRFLKNFEKMFIDLSQYSREVVILSTKPEWY
jgi:hypothetical protein